MNIHSHPHRTTGKVLVVDDEPQVLAVAKAILDAHGFEVIVTDSGDVALNLISQPAPPDQRIELVILDLTMPGGLSGFEVLEEMRRMDPALPIIACSGYFQENARDLCQAIGFSDILPKPYTLDHLVATVRGSLVRSHQLA
ncbi:MAG TPA: two-component system response regulator [Verrucomicrobiales bacterium]|nr:two-component system response regulator [Verrucomicrobiales bacterium]HCN78894.1 two-component system response regulator [Verrucomicrobiales bacterium]HRJ07350.1 response regulator [Prosthecobacter sp.]HRK13559.1 response regulator [Prosthecobacter sp.]